MDVKMFFWRKNVVISELDFALEILTTALCIELNFMLLHKMDFMIMLMFKAMQACLRRFAETPCQMVVFGAIVELHVPTHRNEEHQEGHHKGADMQ